MKTIRIHHLLLCGLAAAGAVSCEQEERPLGESIYTTHFIQGVILADQLKGEAVEEDGVIYLNLEGTSLERAGKGSTDEFYAAIGDTAYNRYVSQDPLTAVFANRFASVDITSSEQFLEIPAGESLAGYVLFRGATALPYIESMYNIGGFWPEQVLDEFMTGMGDEDSWYPPFECNRFHPVVKPLTELTQDDLFLLWVRYPGSSLRFTATPEIKSHVFSITMRDTDGSTLTCSVPFNFPGQ